MCVFAPGPKHTKITMLVLFYFKNTMNMFVVFLIQCGFIPSSKILCVAMLIWGFSLNRLVLMVLHNLSKASMYVSKF